MNIIRVYKLRQSAKLPHRAHITDAGMDLFYCPDGSQKKLYDTPDYHIPPGASRLLSTGIKVEIPSATMLEIKNKSSVASKKQLIVGACVVDHGYDGEVFVNLHNIGETTQIIKPGQKIAQAVLIPIIVCNVIEAPEDNLNKYGVRGDGALGSTGEF